MKIRKSVKSAMETLGIKKLRRNQLKPINRILDGKDTLLIAKTSFGKSAVALIPAIINKDKLTIFIEPLTALMHDQVKRLQEHGVAAAYLDSTQSSEAQATAKELLGRKELSVLFLAPERLSVELLPQEIYKNDVGMVVVDECHCVVNWGYSFREDYLKIGEFIDSLKHHPVVVAMTASAPPEDRKEIMDLLSMKNAKSIVSSLYRSELQFLKKTCSSREEQRKELLKIMKKYHRHTTIVFCNTVKAVEAVAQELKKAYPGDVAIYHGRDKSSEKAMLSGKKHIIVATTALAMGVDIRDVDLIIHFNMPLSIPDYYQMAGRAGREGRKARSVLLYNPEDYHTNRALLTDISDGTAKKTALARLDAMKELCENEEECMVNVILRALGEERKKSCRYCTNCQKGRRS